VGAAGVALGVAAITRPLAALRVGWLLPLAGVSFEVTGTAGLFMVVTGAVAVAAGCYSVGYFRHAKTAMATLSVLPLFVLTMIGVLAASSVTTLLVMWELMALVSLVAVLSDHHHAAVRDAGRWYAGMTQFGFLAILIGLVVLVHSGGSESLSVLAARAGAAPSSTRDAVFVLTFIGFGAKAGLVPLHVWLPRAHPAAPSPVSAVMSAAMVAVGIYGVVRVDLQILGPGPRWWAMVVLAAGALSALYGVLQASVATDLKRLLAYSTTENMGVVAMGLGAGMLLADYGHPVVADVAVTAALLQVVAHAAFKSLAFLAAGSVVAATGQRDLDHLGGLAKAMPVTTICFAVGALGASGLPLGAGFVSEWLLLQSLIHSQPGSGTLLAVVMPIAVGVVALTTGVGVAAMVKAFGVGFLARPRSPGAALASESAPSMLVGMTMAAAACAVLALAPAVVAPALRSVLSATPQAVGVASPHFGVLLRLPGIAGSLSPLLLAAAAVVATLAVAGATAVAGRSRRAQCRAVALWTCGGGPLSERMEYTATSFAEPLQRVFDGVLRPDVDVEVTHVGASRYLVEGVRYRSVIVDAVEVRLYRPLLGAFETWAGWVRRAHSGSVHLYVAYGAVALAVVLAVAR